MIFDNSSAQSTFLSSLNYTVLSYSILVFSAFVLALFFWGRQKAITKGILKRSLDLIFLEIFMPKETAEDKFGQESSKQDEKELIGIGLQLFSTLSFSQTSFWQNLWHGQDSISFEIAAFEKKIHFFVICPRSQAEVIQRQIHAQYPKAVIEKTQPYSIFNKEGQVATAELNLQRRFIYPIKTYEEQNSDPLNALTNAMSKLVVGESMALQLIITPAPPNWGSLPRKLAEEIQQGKRPRDVDVTKLQKVGREMGKAVQSGVSDLVSASPKTKKENSKNELPISLTPMQQEMVKKFEEKASQVGFLTNIRIVTCAESKQIADINLNTLLAAFTQYNISPFNGFKVKSRAHHKIIRDFVLRAHRKTDVILNATELTSIWHPPTRFTETPNIQWLTSRKAPAPVNIPQEGLLLGVNEYRGVTTEVRILEADRMRHVYIIGRTGTGKTELMKYMAAQDIENGNGVCIIDPHGEFIEDVLTVIPKNRMEDVILFDPSDMERPFGLNMLDIKNESQADFIVQEMIAIFEKLFPPEVIGPMFEHNMRNVMLTLIADSTDPGTLVEIPRMFTDIEFQRKFVSRVKDPTVLSFWEQEMAKTSDFHKSEMLGYLISKVGRFVENTMMRNIIGQKRSSFDFRQVMDEGKILLVNLSKGKIGEINSKLLGLIIVSKLQMAALSRADVSQNQRPNFYLYVDEFQNFVTDSFATILSEARKYHLSLTIAHQYLGQLTSEKPGSSTQDTKVRDAVFGNVGTMVTFRVGVEDAEVIAREMAPTFSEFDVVNIERFSTYTKLMVHNTISRPFSMKTVPLKPQNSPETVMAIKEYSRLKYGRARNAVEHEILERSQLSKMPLEPKNPAGEYAR